MYFYKLMGGGYESSNETTYYSDKKYTQEEFEDIVFDCFKTFCEKMVKDEPISLCYPNIYFSFEDIIWDYKGIFGKLMAEKGFHHLNEKLTAYMFFDLTGDGFFRKIYKDVDNSYHNRANKIISNLDIDGSCWENCSILEEEYDNSYKDIEQEKEFCREDCMVYHRKNSDTQFSL